MTPQASAPHWHVLVTPAASGAENMALDEALMERARATGEWMLRVYSWSRPTISLGRNQTARGCYDMAAVHERGLDVVRRPTGGRAIIHDREVTYSVTAPAGDAGHLRESYDRINRLLVDGLRRMGVEAQVAGPGPGVSQSRTPGIAPCFSEPSAGELTVAGRKLAGSAQWRMDGALLQHGSILLADDQSLLTSLMLRSSAPIPAPATLTAVLGRTPTVRDVGDALTAAICCLEDRAVERFEMDEALRARTSTLVVRYVDEAWTWRR